MSIRSSVDFSEETLQDRRELMVYAKCRKKETNKQKQTTNCNL